MSYLYATVVRQLDDDPANENLNPGDVILVEGKRPDGYRRTVLGDDDFLDVEHETLAVIGPADHRMGKREITYWAADQPEAKEAAGILAEASR